MKFSKQSALMALSVAASIVFTSSASATTLEVGGAPKNEAIAITASLSSGSSLTLKDTAGFAAKTCTSSHFSGATTSPYTTTTITGHITAWSFSNCTRPVVVHNPGKFEIIHISNTTNGTFYIEEFESTTGSPIGTLNCKVSTTNHFGTLTGVKEGQATLDVSAPTNCGIIPSAKLEATFVITSPNGLGVSA